MPAGGCLHIVAEREGRVAACLYASAHRTRPAYRFAVKSSIHLSPDPRRAGAGAVMREALVAARTQKDLRPTVAAIGDPANVPSIELRARAGCTRAWLRPTVAWKQARRGQPHAATARRRPCQLRGGLTRARNRLSCRQ